MGQALAVHYILCQALLTPLLAAMSPIMPLLVPSAMSACTIGPGECEKYPVPCFCYPSTAGRLQGPPTPAPRNQSHFENQFNSYLFDGSYYSGAAPRGRRNKPEDKLSSPFYVVRPSTSFEARRSAEVANTHEQQYDYKLVSSGMYAIPLRSCLPLVNSRLPLCRQNRPPQSPLHPQSPIYLLALLPIMEASLHMQFQISKTFSQYLQDGPGTVCSLG